MYQPSQPLTFDHAKAASDEGLRAISAGQTVIDLASVSAIDSSAVAILLGWQRAARRTASTLQFANLPTKLVSMITLYGVTALLSVEPASIAGADLPQH